MFWTVTQSLMQGMAITVEIFFFTLLFAIPLGLLISLGLVSRFKIIRNCLNVIVWIIRGTPLLLQLFVIFYMPSSALNYNIWQLFAEPRITAAIVAFVINYACYFSIIFKGGIQGVPKGQKEAGLVLGMTKRQIFFKITLLQMVKRVVLPMSNEIITLVKDTSLANGIAICELTYQGNHFLKLNGLVWPVFYTGVFYLAFVGILTIMFNYIEHKLDYFKYE